MPVHVVSEKLLMLGGFLSQGIEVRHAMSEWAVTVQMRPRRRRPDAVIPLAWLPLLHKLRQSSEIRKGILIPVILNMVLQWVLRKAFQSARFLDNKLRARQQYALRGLLCGIDALANST